MLLPQVWGMLAPFTRSWQARRVDKDHIAVTQCRLELSGENPAAGQRTRSPILWASHRYASTRHSWTHHQLCTTKWTPFLLLSLFTGFSRKQPSKSGKPVWLGHQLLRGVAQQSRSPSWKHLKSLCKVEAQLLPLMKGGPPFQLPHFQATLWEPSGSPSGQSFLYPHSLSSGN